MTANLQWAIIAALIIFLLAMAWSDLAGSRPYPEARIETRAVSTTCLW